MDASRTANICSTVAAVAFFVAANAVQGENGHRVGRSDVRAVLGEKMDPNFWPTRGRRSPLAAASDEENEAPFWANRGRSTRLAELQSLLQERAADSDEDPPFWANRGRSLPCDEVRQGQELPFWTNRGRSLPCDTIKQEGALYAEEPYWVMMDRRDDEATSSVVDPFWVARGRRGLLDTLSTSPNDFWASRGKKSPLANRQGENAARALGLNSDQFWPARGKRGATHERRPKDKPHHQV